MALLSVFQIEIELLGLPYLPSVGQLHVNNILHHVSEKRETPFYTNIF